MTEPKLHHYVPRFYLERFTSKGKLWIWDKKTGKDFASTPNSVAAEKHFYRVPELIDSKHDPLFLEKRFAWVEGYIAAITKKWLEEILTLQANDKIAITKDERELVAFYISLQFFRTAEARDILAAFAQDVGRYRNGISADEITNLHGYFLEHGSIIDKLANRLFRSTWIFGKNDTGHPFVTSDHPVCFKTPDNRMWLKSPGILSKGVYLVFPLSPSVILYSHDQRHPKFKKIRKFADRISSVTFDTEMVDHENSGQVFMASRFIISQKRDFAFVREFFRSNVAKQDRPERAPSTEGQLKPQRARS